MRATIATLACLLISPVVPAEPEQLQRAQQNYMLNCQGCHQPDGSGAKDRVPDLRGQVGSFLRVPGGRDYLVRVPGVANSMLGDAELAEVMNWMLVTFSSGQLPGNFAAYSAQEIGSLRKYPLQDPGTERRELIELIANAPGSNQN